MKPAYRFLVASCVIVVLVLASLRGARAEMRTWSDATGKFKIDAEYVELAAGKVKLKTKDGKTMTIPMEKLSPADRKFVNDLVAAAAAAAAQASSGPGPLDSMVRVIGKLPGGAEGQDDEFTLVGIAIAAMDPNNLAGPSIVILASRADVPKNVEASAVDARWRRRLFCRCGVRIRSGP